MATRTRTRRALVFAVMPLVLVGGCTSKEPAGGAPVGVTLRDFHITTDRPTVPAGDVVFNVHNEAPITHEFVVVRTDLPADDLPIGLDGLSVNEDWLTGVGEIDEVPDAQTDALQLNLAPGRYVFFCNLEGHYLGGMHGVLEVTAP